MSNTWRGSPCTTRVSIVCRPHCEIIPRVRPRHSVISWQKVGNNRKDLGPPIPPERVVSFSNGLHRPGPELQARELRAL
jgi:hypothetical protein